MMTRYRVNLNAVGLETISPAIIITDIAYSAPRYATTTASLAGKHGLRMQSRRVQSSAVTVYLEIHEPDIRMRQEICRRVQAWAMKGGYLTTNDRPGQRLRVICDSPPVISSALRWTEKLHIGFVAYEWPFWEDEYETKAVVDVSGGTAKLFVRGTAEEAYVSVFVRNKGDSAINTLTLTAGDTFFSFADLGLSAGGTLEVGYGDDGLLYIRADGVSKMNKRTGESSDDLVLPSGANGSVGMTADGTATATFKVRGQYL